MHSAPREIERSDPGHLRVRWDDGHESLFEFRVLRADCPCAACTTRPRRHPGLLMAGATTPTGLEAVGNYALQITWADGHANGIYSYAALRRACPCASCRAG